jgi:protein O-mannosyl-transferase
VKLRARTLLVQSFDSDFGWVACLVTISFLVFGLSIGFGFSGYDDVVVLRDSDTAHWQGWTALLRYWYQRTPGELFYIPLSYTLFSLQHWVASITGLSFPTVLHSGNVLLHTTNTVLVYLFLKQLSAIRAHAFVGALFFLLHPIQAESVGWILGQRDMASVLFAMLALLCVPPKKVVAWQWVLPSFLFLLSLLCKPTSALVPWAAALLFWGAQRDWKNYGIFAVTSTFILAPVAVVTVLFRSESSIPLDYSLVARLKVVGNAIWFYFGKLLVPTPLVPHYDPMALDRVLAGGTFTITAFIGFALLVVMLVAAWNRRWAWAAVVAFCVMLLPAMGWIHFSYQIHSVVADRFLYPSMMAVGFAIAHGLGRFQQIPNARWLVLLPVIGAMSWLSFQQIQIWKSPVHLWANTLEVYPWSRFARATLAKHFQDKGDLEMAYEILKPFTDRYPEDEVTQINLATVLSEKGDLEAAEALFKKVLSAHPNHPVALRNLGNVYFEQKHWKKALQIYQRVSDLNPRRADILRDIADCYWELGELEGALERYRVYLSAYGNDEAVLQRVRDSSRPKISQSETSKTIRF